MSSLRLKLSVIFKRWRINTGQRRDNSLEKMNCWKIELVKQLETSLSPSLPPTPPVVSLLRWGRKWCRDIWTYFSVEIHSRSIKVVSILRRKFFLLCVVTNSQLLSLWSLSVFISMVVKHYYEMLKGSCGFILRQPNLKLHTIETMKSRIV